MRDLTELMGVEPKVDTQLTHGDLIGHESVHLIGQYHIRVRLKGEALAMKFQELNAHARLGDFDEGRESFYGGVVRFVLV